MNNQISDGKNIAVLAAAAASSGDFVAIGELQGVAVSDVAIGGTLVLATEGVFALPKEATTDTFAIGAPVEWDAGAGEITALAGGRRIGVVTKAAIATDATAHVLLRAGFVDLIE